MATEERIAPIIALPKCSIDGCGVVSTRRLYSLEVDGENQGTVRLCWEHTKEYHLDENDKYESEGEL